MKHIKLFENYLFEAANAETLESPEASKGVKVEEYLAKVKGEETNDRDKNSEYFTACKQFAASFAGKSMKVPNYGMVPKSTFKFEGFADCCFAIMSMSKGAGVWNNALRKEESKLETGYFPTVFVAGYATKDKGFADMDFNAEVNGPKKTITPALSGYYCYLNIHKRTGKDIDMKATPEKFTMQELVALDPQWKGYFQNLINLAEKFQ
jgi:hypothetical protein